MREKKERTPAIIKSNYQHNRLIKKHKKTHSTKNAKKIKYHRCVLRLQKVRPLSKRTRRKIYRKIFGSH